jgi:hypothetical protein
MIGSCDVNFQQEKRSIHAAKGWRDAAALTSALVMLMVVRTTVLSQSLTICLSYTRSCPQNGRSQGRAYAPLLPTGITLIRL